MLKSLFIPPVCVSYMSGEREGHMVEKECRSFARSCGCRKQRGEKIACNGITGSIGAPSPVRFPRPSDAGGLLAIAHNS